MCGLIYIYIRYACLNRTLFLLKRLDLSGMWQGLRIRLDIKNDMCYDHIGLIPQNKANILVKIIERECAIVQQETLSTY